MIEDNIPGFIGYHITKDGELYSRRIEKQRRLERLIDLGKSRMYISKRLKVSRKTLYNFIHRIQIRNSLE